MSRQPTESPQLVDIDPLHGETYSHPAFAQISASRVSGIASLYDSEFNHNGFVTVRICRSQLKRNLSNDWHFGREELIEVAMSEAQWATFVSSMNVGSGVPCTLQHIQRKAVPQLPPPEDPSTKYADELRAHLAETRNSIAAIVAELNNGSIGKRKVAELTKRLEWLSNGLVNTSKFIADQFDEHMEETVEKAKVEVNAYATSAIMRAGLKAIGDGTPPVQIEYKEGGAA